MFIKTTEDELYLQIKELENDIKILYILGNLGPQRFTELEQFSDLSKSTVSKYLKLHLNKHLIKKDTYIDPVNNINEQRYFITERGIEILNESVSKIEDRRITFSDEINANLIKLEEMINFYKRINVDDSIIHQIITLISKIGSKFFEIDQDENLYLTLFYIINYNSILTQKYKMQKRQFCQLYGIKELYLDFYIDKVMSSGLGFYMFVRGDDVFFFHEQDILGSITLRLIKDKLIEQLIDVNLDPKGKIYDLDKMAEEIAEHIKKMDLIWFGIQEQFEMLIEKLLIKTALEMGFSKKYLTDLALPSGKISKSEEGASSLINIIEGSDRYEDYNVVSIPVTKEVKLDDYLGPLKGFCPNCGSIILKQDTSNRCSRCEYEFKSNELLGASAIAAAKETGMRYKQEKLQEDQLTTCPNPNCEAMIRIDWNEDRCPYCASRIRMSDGKNYTLISIKCPNPDCDVLVNPGSEECPKCKTELYQINEIIETSEPPEKTLNESEN